MKNRGKGLKTGRVCAGTQQEAPGTQIKAWPAPFQNS